MRESVLLVVGAVVAVVLQIVLAPNLVILGAMPDLVLVYVGIAAMLLRRDSVLVMAFFAGLAMDLVGTSTVGVCAGLYTLIAFLSSRAAGFFGNDTLGASLAISMAITCGAITARLHPFSISFSNSCIPTARISISISSFLACFFNELITIALDKP